MADVVFLTGQFFAFGQGVFFVRRRADGEAFGRGHGDVAFGIDLAGDDGDVASGLNGQVASGTGSGTQLGDVAAVVFAVREQAVGDFGRGDGDVASGLDAHVTTAFQHAAFVDDVAACRNAHVVGSFDARGAVGELVVALTACTVVHRGDAAFVDHIAVDRGQ
ncbi:hypothetical protein ALP54_200031 [Pseudomonas amygdali pv. lachrymans]|nr:hypothetical protein ALP54_200031 [Pseudomonas amygdali pv. lachrymans]